MRVGLAAPRVYIQTFDVIEVPLGLPGTSSLHIAFPENMPLDPLFSSCSYPTHSNHLALFVLLLMVKLKALFMLNICFTTE